MSKSKRKARPSTALAIRKPAAPSRALIRVNDPAGILPAAVNTELAAGWQLGEVASTHGIGLAPAKLTKAEELIVSREVKRADVMIKPDGIAYLSHIFYTRWLNEAFGRTGWSIVPVARPSRTDNLITVPYVLMVKGRGVAIATGEQEYHEKNARQTFGDAVESTVASGLRRCCKRFGMALELWDKRWLYNFLQAEGVEVEVRARDGSYSKQWRRRTDPPLPYEKGGSSKAPPKTERAPATGDGSGAEKITKEQAKRMVSIWRKAGRGDADVQLWLSLRYKLRSTNDIRRADYDDICRQLEARGELALPGDGERR